jgi:hypothetical protein
MNRLALSAIFSFQSPSFLLCFCPGYILSNMRMCISLSLIHGVDTSDSTKANFFLCIFFIFFHLLIFTSLFTSVIRTCVTSLVTYKSPGACSCSMGSHPFVIVGPGGVPRRSANLGFLGTCSCLMRSNRLSFADADRRIFGFGPSSSLMRHWSFGF